MNKKMIVTLIVLLLCAGCLSIASAANITNETLGNNENVDMSNYITPISIKDVGIEFSDGFTGFCLDLTKDPIAKDDGFASQKTDNDKIQNYIKLAIIEAYKQGRENNLSKIVANFADESYKNSNDGVITAVLKSQETIGDNATVELEDSIEGTFEFELLKDVKGEKSDCLAYKVSLKEIPHNNATNGTGDNNTNSNNNTDGKTDNATDNKTDGKTDNATDNKTEDNKNQQTTINETNKTNTVILNENNTTIINQNNIKVINKTNQTPQNASLPDKIMRTAGNPIFLLIVVVAIAAIAAVVMRRKDK